MEVVDDWVAAIDAEVPGAAGRIDFRNRTMIAHARRAWLEPLGSVTPFMLPPLCL